MSNKMKVCYNCIYLKNQSDGYSMEFECVKTGKWIYDNEDAIDNVCEYYKGGRLYGGK